jgi:hypothetical protein
MIISKLARLSYPYAIIITITNQQRVDVQLS